MRNLKIKTEVFGDFLMNYDPQINDYVKWNNHEGWVYFKGDEYITIEIGTNPKSDDLVPMHKKHHILLVCYNHLWHELEYVKKRKSKHDTP